MIPQQVTKDGTHMLQRNVENLSVPKSQPEIQVHSVSSNSNHQVSPNAQDSGSENYEDSTPLLDNGVFFLKTTYQCRSITSKE